jgi:catechol 2,3-dioxygenase-like lactoylglutathione lyase family enzyme
MDMKLEVAVLPVSDPDCARRFRLVTAAVPGSIDSLLPALDDIDAVREELRSRGVEVSDVFRDTVVASAAACTPAPPGGAPDPDPQGRSTSQTRRSVIPTATAGCCRKSRSDSPDGCKGRRTRDPTRDSTGATGRWPRQACAEANRPTEVNMSSTEVGSASSTEMAELSTIDMGLEVVTVPVSDVERAKRFYQSIGWRLDADFAAGEGARLVQMTPPHSQCSIHFGNGVPGIDAMEPGSLQRVYLAVKDIDAAREDLVKRGVDVSEVEEQPKPPGFPDLPGRSYFAYASFSDPDGNGWLLQEVTTRLPGREWAD